MYMMRLEARRPYKKGFSEEKSLRILKEGAGTQFDPAVVDAFIEHSAEIREIRTKWQD